MGAVENVQKTETGLCAAVVENENYEVEIKITDGRVYDMWCSCPYAKDGNYCKHMAAVLFKSDESARGIEEGEKTWQARYLESNQELLEVIGKIPETELRRILAQLAQENESFRNHIITKYSSSVTWLFADTPKGATANAVLYTLVESARANELDVYEYLKYLLNEMPNKDFNDHPEILDQYLPWSSELPEECRLNHNYR